jgi:FtsH-binding integral membrane protein
MDNVIMSNPQVAAAQRQFLERRIISTVFTWMSLGLLLTAAVAYYTASSQDMIQFIFGNRFVFFGLIIAEFGLVMAISAAINRVSAMTATAMFFAYAGLNGLTLASIFLVYKLGSIAGVFFVTAGTFGAMALYGYTTKRDLTSFGNILMMALIGIVIASVVNMFFGSGMLNFIISIVGVLVFTGLTAYDTQKIKEFAGQGDIETENKMAVLGALTLYLDFVNLFLMLLRLFGGRNDD